MDERARHTEIVFRGISLSGGVALGRARMQSADPLVGIVALSVPPEAKGSEGERLLQAVQQASKSLDYVIADVSSRIGRSESLIFKVQKAILDDPALIGQIIDKINTEGLSAEAAVVEILGFYEARISELDDEYIRDRGSDLAEVYRRVLDELRAEATPAQMTEHKAPTSSAKGEVIVTDQLTPGMTMDVDPDRIVALVSQRGGRTSHAAILARAMGIPAVSGLQGICDHIPQDAELLVDGDAGRVILWPSEQTLDRFHDLERKAVRIAAPEEPIPELIVMANINLSTDIDDALAMKAEGVGLYRTEFEFFAAGRVLTEDEQYERYRSTLEAMEGKPVHFRLLDIGGDKAMDFLGLPKEDNPYLGHRGSRLLLDRADLMRPQVRALARASEHGVVRVMYPMVTELEQFERLRGLFCEEGRDIPTGQILHGVMFEVPAACLQARDLLTAADFGSIGTNDLIQYLYAVDRNNDRAAYDYSPDKAMFWWMIQHIVRAAQEAGRPLSVCGEAASRPRFLPKLMDLGINTVSASPRLIPGLRRTVIGTRRGS